MDRPLSSVALDFLSRWPRTNQTWVFPSETGQTPYQGIGKVWREVRKEAKLEDVRLHDLRHSFASFGITARLPIPLRTPRGWNAERCLGHGVGFACLRLMSDRLFDERPFRILTIVDCHTREALATSARTNFRAYQVIDELDRIARLRGKPRSIRVDNGPEFAGRLLDQWAYLNKVELDFSRPGKPTDNAYIEAFNSRLRQECLNAAWFLSMADARSRLNEWRDDYNENRPHSALGNLTPSAFAALLEPARKVA